MPLFSNQLKVQALLLFAFASKVQGGGDFLQTANTARQTLGSVTGKTFPVLENWREDFGKLHTVAVKLNLASPHQKDRADAADALAEALQEKLNSELQNQQVVDRDDKLPQNQNYIQGSGFFSSPKLATEKPCFFSYRVLKAKNSNFSSKSKWIDNQLDEHTVVIKNPVDAVTTKLSVHVTEFEKSTISDGSYYVITSKDVSYSDYAQLMSCETIAVVSGSNWMLIDGKSGEQFVVTVIIYVQMSLDIKVGSGHACYFVEKINELRVSNMGTAAGFDLEEDFLKRIVNLERTTLLLNAIYYSTQIYGDEAFCTGFFRDFQTNNIFGSYFEFSLHVVKDATTLINEAIKQLGKVTGYLKCVDRAARSEQDRFKIMLENKRSVDELQHILGAQKFAFAITARGSKAILLIEYLMN